MRRGCNWGCLAVVLLAVAVDALAYLALRALTLGLAAMCGMAAAG